MPIVELPDGTEAEFPDSMSDEDIKAVLRKKFPVEKSYEERLSEGRKELVKGMGPVEGAVAAFGEGGRHAIRQAANLLPLPEGWKPSDAEVLEASKMNKELFAAHPYAGALGNIAISAGPGLGVGAAKKAVGFLPRALSVLKGAGAGAAQGAVFADPGAREETALAGGVLGGGIGAAAHGASALMSKAKPRAFRQALKVLEPSAEEAAKAEGAFGSLEAAGEAIDRSGAAKIGLTLRDRRDLLEAMGETAGKEMSAIIKEAEARGASVDPKALLDSLMAARQRLFSRPGAGTTTPALRRGASAADRYIADVADELGLQMGPVAPIRAVENAKQAAQDAAKFHGKAYTDPRLAGQDPGVRFFGKASTALKQAPENAMAAVDPDLASRFIEAKGRSGVAQAFAPVAGKSAMQEFAQDNMLQGGSSPRGALFRSFYNPVASHLRPYMIPVNKALQAVHDVTPDYTDTALRAAIIEYLRDREE